LKFMSSKNIQSSSQELPPLRKQMSKFNDLVIVSKINQANFDVFLTYSPSFNHYFALKAFPYKKNKINPFFENEVRFSRLRHKNVISPLYAETCRTIFIEDQENKVSFTLMELAPYGDFFDIIITRKIFFDDKLVRTYFHQLIAGLEFLHLKEIAHLDIKPENLLVGMDFQLKISDFDHSIRKGQSQIPTKGTLYYRAPEIIKEACEDYYAADIYSAGVILFLLKSGGMLPHVEHKRFNDVDLLELLDNHTETFWKKHSEFQMKSSLFFDKDFKDLFTWMMKTDPKQRPSIAEIKASKWFNGPIYNDYELIEVMETKFGFQDHER